MAKISDVTTEPFREINQTILDNFMDDEICEIESASHTLRGAWRAQKRDNYSLLMAKADMV